MKVKELIVKLQQMDQEAEVCENGDWGINPLSGEVKQIQVYVQDKNSDSCIDGKYCDKNSVDKNIEFLKKIIIDPNEISMRDLWEDSLAQDNLKVTSTIETIVVIC